MAGSNRFQNQRVSYNKAKDNLVTVRDIQNSIP